MTELLTAAQMRAIEAAAIASGDVTGLELMERAGQGVVDAIFAQWPDLAPAASGERGPAPSSRRAVVLCGPGNNGGDGFVVARLLREAGWDVDVFLYGDATRLPADARVNYERWVEMAQVVPLTESAMRAKLTGSELIVDALFGTGLTRPASLELASVLRYLSGSGGDNYQAKTIAIDLPSGICGNSGRVITQRPQASFPEAIRAGLTVTFDSPKIGHFIASGPARCGAVVVVDIGVQHFRETQPHPNGLAHRVVAYPHAKLLSEQPLCPDTRPFFESPGRNVDKDQGHKFSHGHALVLSGGPGKGGAARLAARGALRIGAGLVTVGVLPKALAENAARLDAVMLTEVADVSTLQAVLADTRINALCVGPGFGTGPREKALLAAVLEAQRPVVLDADALTILSQEPVLFDALHEKCVLTPHAGEFARLFPDIAQKLSALAIKGPAYSKVDAARDAAKRTGCFVLFKGPDTVIAAPDGRCSINASVYERSAPWLATAGSGDVLAGFITGLLARGFAPLEAAEAGAWLHTECALAFGPGLIAEDLPEVLPQVLGQLLENARG